MDSAAVGEGEERAPATLLEAGLSQCSALAPVLLETQLRNPQRDSQSGVIALEELRSSTAAIEIAVAATLDHGNRPLLLGGDCAVLPGALGAACRALPELRLLYLDGHPDACDGATSPSGEAADMTLAVLSTSRVPQLAPAGAALPLLAPERVALIGFRGDAPADIELPDGSSLTEASLLPDGLVRIAAADLRARGPRRVAREALAAIGAGPLWLQLDLDVLDASEMHAVSYPQPGGPSAVEIAELLSEVLSATEPVGASLTCLNPDLDHDGSAIRTARGLLSTVMAAA